MYGDHARLFRAYTRSRCVLCVLAKCLCVPNERGHVSRKFRHIFRIHHSFIRIYKCITSDYEFRKKEWFPTQSTAYFEWREQERERETEHDCYNDAYTWNGFRSKAIAEAAAAAAAAKKINFTVALVLDGLHVHNRTHTICALCVYHHRARTRMNISLGKFIGKSKSTAACFERKRIKSILQHSVILCRRRRRCCHRGCCSISCFIMIITHLHTSLGKRNR